MNHIKSPISDPSRISEKQKVYLDILEFVLPYLRSIQTNGILRRLRHRTFYFYQEIELVHNLPRLLVIPEFEEYDVHWLNTQARNFVLRGRKDFPFYQRVCDDIRTLFALLPDDLRQKLIWNGPET
jgi:hypothetical protein